MSYDLVIRNGEVVDGSGLARYRADVAIRKDRIVRIGRVDEKGDREIDADGHVVTPGFIDGHTHMDAQLFWNPMGSCSCWHGVTSVVMGNCGFTLAPSRPKEHDLVVSNLERAEDISGAAMAAGINWNWETFPEYLDAVAAEPKAINYAAQIGHSALRTFAMGERAFSEQASEDELALMTTTLREALLAGAIGFTSSRGERHARMDGRPVASRIASWEELTLLVTALGLAGNAVFELAPSQPGDPEGIKNEYVKIRDLAVATRVPITIGLRVLELDFQLENLDATASAGGRIFAQTRSTPSEVVFSFKSQMPYDRIPAWKDFRSRPHADQLESLRQPAIRNNLVGAVDDAYSAGGLTTLTAANVHKERLPSYEDLRVVQDGVRDQSVASLASERGVKPIELIIELALETHLEQVLCRSSDGWNDANLLRTMKHPRTVMTFSDSGAHVSFQSGADLQTRLLSYWVRERQAFTLEEAIRMITLVPALNWNMHDRGLLREGAIADINVLDPDAVGTRAPTIETDLPAGGTRVVQKAAGYLATVVNGVQTLRSGESTGEFPGVLIRRSNAS